MKCISCGLNIIKPELVETDTSHPTHLPINEEQAIFDTTKFPDLSGEELKKFLESGDKPNTIRAENRMWYGGVVGNISAGYGSDHDGDKYVIAICDKCINDRIQDGTMAHIGNYMFDYNKDDMEKLRSIWRRSNNLDNLLDS